MSRIDVAFMLFVLGTGVASFTAGLIMLQVAKAGAAETLYYINETKRLRGWIKYAESECHARFGQAPTDMFGEALAGCPVPLTGTPSIEEGVGCTATSIPLTEEGKRQLTIPDGALDGDWNGGRRG